MERKCIKYLIKNLFAGSSSIRERAEIAKWINSGEAESDSREAWENAPEDINRMLKQEIWNRIRPHIKNTTPEPTSRRHISVRKSRVLLKIAAAIVGVSVCSALTSYLLYDRYIGNQKNIADNIYSFEVEPGQKGSIRLPDGTVIYLNSASGISFSADYNTASRRVDLDGEAYFEVAKNPDKKFIVSCNGIEIEALGTEFNVKAYAVDSTIVTTLAKGKVKVSSQEQSVTLLPKEAATYHLKRNRITSSAVEDISIADYWRSGQLVFAAEPLSSIARIMERMYNVKIDIQDATLKDMKFTGTIRNNSLNNVMHIISLSYPLTYSITDSVITVSRQSRETIN